MEWLQLDEASQQKLYRWMNLCRLAMYDHPSIGADFYSIWLGEKTPYKTGWNKVTPPKDVHRQPFYVLISPDSGWTTTRKPSVDDSLINHISQDDIAPFGETSLCSQLRVLTTEVIRLNPADEEPRITFERIVSIGNEPPFGYANEAEAITGQVFQDIRKSLDQASFSLAIFQTPIADLVTQYMRFETRGTLAASVIATLLAYYAMKYPNPLRPNGTEIYGEQIGHLINLVEVLEEERRSCDLGTFSRYTYLALLLARVASIMCFIGVLRTDSDRLSTQFRKWDQYIDEVSAHKLWPSFRHPIQLVPLGTDELRAALSHLWNRDGIYPGAEPLENVNDPEERWLALAAHSKKAPTRDVNVFLTVEQLLAPGLIANLKMFLLAMSIGSGSQSI